MDQRNINSDLPIVFHARCVTGVGGGPEKTILNSGRFLRPRGYRSVCGYMHPPGDLGFEDLIHRAEVAETELLSFPDLGVTDLRVLFRMIAWCRRNRVAIWHGHDYKSDLFGLIARRFWNMKLVTTVHGWGVQKTRRSPFYNAIDRKCLPFYDEVICVSDDIYRTARACGVIRSRCHPIHNGIDVEQFCVRDSHRSSKVTGPIRIGAMGRLSGEKGFDLLIDAIVRLNHAGVDCRLEIAGEGVQRVALERQILDLDAAQWVTLPGHIMDVKRFYADLDLFALSSRSEGLPNVLLEAMAMQVPVVATRVGGVSRLIESGRNGILVSPESADQLQKAIARLVVSDHLRKKLSAAARETIERDYGFANRMDKIAAIYDRLLGGSALQDRDRRLAEGADRPALSVSAGVNGQVSQ